MKGERLVEGERLEWLPELRGLRPLFGGLGVVVLRREDARPEESLEDTEREETLEDARLVVLKLEGPCPGPCWSTGGRR